MNCFILLCRWMLFLCTVRLKMCTAEPIYFESGKQIELVWSVLLFTNPTRLFLVTGKPCTDILHSVELENATSLSKARKRFVRLIKALTVTKGCVIYFLISPLTTWSSILDECPWIRHDVEVTFPNRPTILLLFYSGTWQ